MCWRVSESLRDDSYGRIIRRAIAAREARVAERLRAMQWAYPAAIEEVVVLVPPLRASLGFLAKVRQVANQVAHAAQQLAVPAERVKPLFKSRPAQLNG